MRMKPIGHRSQSQLVLAVAAAMTLEACASMTYTSGVPYCATPPPPPIPVSYALVEYRAGEIAEMPKVEVNQTDAYKTNRTTYKSVAIHVPDGCLQASGSAGSSRPGEKQTILSTSCGAYFSELEKAFTKFNYRVFSWDALRGLERQKSLAPDAAGKELGADVVIVFNHLDVAAVDAAGGGAGPSFKYFVSDDHGARGVPLAVDDATQTTFREFAKAHAGTVTARGVVALASTVDATALATSGGESVWFYRGTVTKPLPSSSGMRLLFGRKASVEGVRGAEPWTPATPQVPESASPPGKVGDTAGSRAPGGVAGPYATEKLDLIRDVARDFVTKFQNGEK
jgi:hypothetical protein